MAVRLIENTKVIESALATIAQSGSKSVSRRHYGDSGFGKRTRLLSQIAHIAPRTTIFTWASMTITHFQHSERSNEERVLVLAVDDHTLLSEHGIHLNGYIR